MSEAVVVLLSALMVSTALAIITVVVVFIVQRQKQRPTPGVGEFGPVPSWAAGDGSAANTETMRRLNSSNTRIDFILYGDSITAWSNKDQAFNKAFGQWVAVPMGKAGDTVEQLAKRITSGDELPSKPPKCIALLIGTNNIPKNTFATAAVHLEELIRWLQRAYPTTKVVLMALLPRGKFSVQAPNQTLRQVAASTSVMFAECGTAMDPANKQLFYDGLHLTAKGYGVVFDCLKKLVQPVLSS